MEESIKQLPLESIAEEPAEDQVARLEGKTRMLDEVEQLIDLMSAEKATFLCRIASLEADLREEHERKERVMEEMESAKARWFSVEQQQRQQAEEEREQWKKLYESEQVANRSLREQITELEKQVFQKDKVITQLESFGQCQVTELESQLKTAFTQHKKIQQSLEIQNSENMTLKVQLQEAQEQHNAAKRKSCALEMQLQECQQKCTQQQNEVLALRGRLTNSKKAYEKIHARCQLMEAEVQSPKVVRVYSRRSEEDKLLMECKKKDELLESCLKFNSNLKTEQAKLQDRLRILELRLNKAEDEKLYLQSTLQDFQSKMSKADEQLCSYQWKERQFSQLKSEMEGKLLHLETQLSDTKMELADMQKAFHLIEQRHAEECTADKHEQKKMQALLKESKDTIKWLNSQLDKERQEHSKIIEKITHEWQQEMQQSLSDYRQMKEAGARRCAQLARDLWDLKSKLNAQ